MSDVRDLGRLTSAFRGDQWQVGDAAAASGGAAPWFWGVPAAFHALAAPELEHPLPRAPETRSDGAQAIGYWAALQYLLLRRLGWARPASGLTWWYNRGRPLQDPTLAFISRAWPEAHVDAYLAWSLAMPRRYPLGASTDVSTAPSGTRVPESWASWSSRTLQMSPWFKGGTDPLHLGVHIGEDGPPDDSAQLIVNDEKHHRAVLLCSSMSSWYRALMRLGADLPVHASPAWRVEVYVRPVGLLGTFRHSWSTGLWFTGRHHIHMAGNDPAIEDRAL